MITFKQYLLESEDEIDNLSVEKVIEITEWAKLYVKHCTQWRDIETPLYRITRAEGAQQTKFRKHGSQGGSGKVWEWMSKQPEWKNYPDRAKSIFCSTTSSINYGFQDGETPLKCIFPYDGTKFGQVKTSRMDNDFNAVKIKGYSREINLAEIEMCLSYFGSDFDESVEKMKQAVSSNDFSAAQTIWGSVDDLDIRNIRNVESVIDKLTPEMLGITLETAATLDFSKKKSGYTQEVWFEGSYLSVPKPHLNKFIELVNSLKE